MCCSAIVLISKNNPLIGNKILQIRMIEQSRAGQLTPQFAMHIFDDNGIFVDVATSQLDYVVKWNAANPTLPILIINGLNIETSTTTTVTSLKGDYLTLQEDSTPALDENNNYIFSEETIIY